MNEPLTRSLQRTAGLRFSQFIAHWPAAAEFLRWHYGNTFVGKLSKYP
jgi:hypothetical protein